MASTAGISCKSEVRFSGDTYINILDVHLKQQLMWYKRPAEDGQIYVRLVSVSHYASLVGRFCMALLYTSLQSLYDGCISNLTQRLLIFQKSKHRYVGSSPTPVIRMAELVNAPGLGSGKNETQLSQVRVLSGPLDHTEKQGPVAQQVEHYTFLTLGDTLHLHHQADHLIKLINRLLICNYEQYKNDPFPFNSLKGKQV